MNIEMISSSEKLPGNGNTLVNKETVKPEELPEYVKIIEERYCPIFEWRITGTDGRYQIRIRVEGKK